MKVFKFQLQKVLDLRVAAEKASAQALGVALHELGLSEERRRRLLQVRNSVLTDLDVMLKEGGLDTTRVRRGHLEVETIDRGIRALLEREKALRAKVQSCQDDLRNRRKDRKAFESLRDQAKGEHASEVRREDGKEMDEIASVRHARARERRAVP